MDAHSYSGSTNATSFGRSTAVTRGTARQFFSFLPMLSAVLIDLESISAVFAAQYRTLCECLRCYTHIRLRRCRAVTRALSERYFSVDL
jgi:hypothetical protein